MMFHFEPHFVDAKLCFVCLLLLVPPLNLLLCDLTRNANLSIRIHTIHFLSFFGQDIQCLRLIAHGHVREPQT